MMSVDKAIRLAQKWAAGHVCTLREGEAQEYHQLCAEALERSRWIPMTERLPEIFARALICTESGEVGEAFKSEWAKSGWAWVGYDGPYVDEKVTHWMPLPNKPKEE